MADRETANIRLFIEVLPGTPGGIRLMLKRLEDGEKETEKKKNLDAVIVSSTPALSFD